MRRVFPLLILLSLLGRVGVTATESPRELEQRLRADLASVATESSSAQADTLRLELAQHLVFTLESNPEEAVVLLEPLLDRALAATPPDPALIEDIQSCLGTAYSYVGRDAEAEILLNASCDSATHRLGSTASVTLKLRGNRASFYARTQRPALAEPELRAIARTFHDRDPDSHDALHARTQWSISLGRLGRWPEAETELRDIFARRVRLLGSDSPELAHQLNLLCWVLFSTDRSADAIPLMEKLVVIRTREFGPVSPLTLTVRYNLAAVYARASRYDDAEKILRADLAHSESLGDEAANETADYLYKLGELALYRQHPTEAVVLLTRTELLYLQSEFTGKLNAEQRDLEKTRQLLARAHIAAGDHNSARRITTAWLAQLEAQFNLHLSYTSEADRLAFLANEDPFDLPGTLGDPALLARTSLHLKGLVLDSLLEDQSLARASADPTVKQLLADYHAALTTSLHPSTPPTTLEATRLEQLERTLARHAIPATISRAALRADPASLLAQLPPATAFVDFILYQHDLPGLIQQARYLALVATSSGWQLIPLGPASTIDDAVARYHVLVNRGGPLAWAQEVRRLILDPVRAALPPETKQLYLSPDGLLHSVVFSTLPEDDSNLIAADHHTFATVTSARDLIPSAPAANPGHPLVLAAPSWSGELASLAPLPGSAAEGTAVAAQFPTAILLTGPDATSAALARHPSPRVLHIATHALVSSDPDLSSAQRLRRSGLALAGESGLLDPLQISALDLRGTTLVFLSGCETGGGTVAHGEGVLGLQRGFARAGARALVLTLWPVADEDSRALTAHFYAAFAQSDDPVAALRSAQRKFRETLLAQGISPAEVLRRAGAHLISIRR